MHRAGSRVRRRSRRPSGSEAVAECVRHLFDDPDRPAVVHAEGTENADTAPTTADEIWSRHHGQILFGGVDLLAEADRRPFTRVVEQLQHGRLALEKGEDSMQLAQVLPQLDHAAGSPYVDVSSRAGAPLVPPQNPTPQP